MIFRVARVHPEQVAGEDGRLVAARAGPDLQEDVLVVARVLGDEQLAQVSLGRRDVPPHAAHLFGSQVRISGSASLSISWAAARSRSRLWYPRKPFRERLQPRIFHGQVPKLLRSARTSAVASSRPTSSNRSVIFSRRWRMDSFMRSVALARRGILRVAGHDKHTICGVAVECSVHILVGFAHYPPDKARQRGVRCRKVAAVLRNYASLSATADRRLCAPRSAAPRAQPRSMSRLRRATTRPRLRLSPRLRWRTAIARQPPRAMRRRPSTATRHRWRGMPARSPWLASMCLPRGGREPLACTRPGDREASAMYATVAIKLYRIADARSAILDFTKDHRRRRTALI